MNQKTISFLSLFILFIFSSSPLFSLTPPIPKETLQNKADLIVEGEVGAPIECFGKIEKEKCYDRISYKVPLKIKKILKGKETAKTITVTFFQNDYSKSRCVGDQGANLISGDQGIYYLKKSASENSFTPLHWSAVILSVHGTALLPECK